MTLSQPWGKFSMSGRPPSVRQSDIRALEYLATLMPRDELRNAARRCLSAGPAGRVTKLDLPRMLARLPKQLVAEGGGRAAIRRRMSGGGVVPPDVVEEEAEIAAQELIRHWVDSVRLAWEQWGESGKVMELSDDGFLPLPLKATRSKDWATWQSDVEESLDVLLSTVALSVDDVPTIMRGFRSHVIHDLDAKSPLDVPHGLCLVMAAERRPAVTARPT